MAHIAMVYLRRAHDLEGSAKVAPWSEMALPAISRAGWRMPVRGNGPAGRLMALDTVAPEEAFVYVLACVTVATVQKSCRHILRLFGAYRSCRGFLLA